MDEGCGVETRVARAGVSVSYFERFVAYLRLFWVAIMALYDLRAGGGVRMLRHESF